MDLFLSGYKFPWEITQNSEKIVKEILKDLNNDFVINGEIAVHRNAKVEDGARFKGPVVISDGCFVSSSAFLRDGVFLDKRVIVGNYCEIKSCFVFESSVAGHLNYVGDSIIGSRVNFEAGSVVANHFNERKEKEITVLLSGKKIKTGVYKFGALVGDDSKIGANSVLSPGTVLNKNSIIDRLQLISQVK